MGTFAYIKKLLYYAAPLLVILALFCCGIHLNKLFPDFNLWLGLGCAIFAVIISIFLRKSFIALWCIALFGGWADAQLQDNEPNTSVIIEAPHSFRARIISSTDYETSLTAKIIITHIDNTICKHPIKAKLSISDYIPNISEGYDIDFNATFHDIKPSLDLPFENDPATHSINDKYLIRTFISADSVTNISQTDGLVAMASRLKLHEADLIKSGNLQSSTKEFVCAVLLGVTDILSPDTRDTFSQTGLSHVLALSGLHVGLIAIIISLALCPLYLFGKKKWILILTILILWSYAFFVGLSASVTRAVVMVSIYYLGILFQLRTMPLNSLCFAALIILIFSPDDLYAIGFQMSFLAVLSIILFANKLNFVSPKKRIAHSIMSYPCVTISATAGSSIVAMSEFHTFPLYFLPANLVAAMILPLLVGVAFIYLVLLNFGLECHLITTLVDALYQALIKSANFFASLPHASITNIYISKSYIVPWITVLFTGHLWIESKKRIFGYVFFAILFSISASLILTKRPHRTERMYIARTTYHTEFVFDNNSDSLIIVSTLTNSPNEITLRAQSRYSDYLGLYDIDSIFIANISDSITLNKLSIRNNIINWGKKKIAVLNSNKLNPGNEKVDYLVLCKGFSGKITSYYKTFRPDTIIFSRDFHKKLTARYTDSCLNLSVPTIQMREQGWSLTP